MEEHTAERKPAPKTRRRKRRKAGPYPVEFRLRAVKMYLEEGYPGSLITAELGISGETLNTWSKRYRQYGEEGLRDLRKPVKRSRLSARVTEKIVELKKANPGFGSRRIADVLRRFFLLPASPATVHNTLSRAQLTTKQHRKRKKNPGTPTWPCIHVW